MKRFFLLAIFLFVLIFLFSCSENRKQKSAEPLRTDTIVPDVSTQKDTIVDADFTFDEAVAGTKAPQKIIDELALFDVLYLSTDGKIHKGQILSNKKIAKDVQDVFHMMLDSGFVVEKVVPVVRYGWNDSLSMADNNTYSFCYRNLAYSKHARGMAIDINPRFNPVRYKRLKKPNEPAGAVLDTTVNGTFYPGHFIVEEFRKRGFRWGHTFSKYYDDHHFEKR